VFRLTPDPSVAHARSSESRRSGYRVTDESSVARRNAGDCERQPSGAPRNMRGHAAIVARDKPEVARRCCIAVDMATVTDSVMARWHGTLRERASVERHASARRRWSSCARDIEALHASITAMPDDTRRRRPPSFLRALCHADARELASG
jgi:hypothetical protein